MMSGSKQVQLDTLDVDMDVMDEEYGPALERQFRGHRAAPSGLAFHPNLPTSKLASVAADKTLMLWNFESTSRCYRFQGHTDAVTDVSFSPNGKLVATSSRDRTIRLWVPTVKGETGEFRAHLQTVRSVHFSPCGQKLVSASDDKSVKLWSVHRKKFLQSYINHRNWVRCARFSYDGRMIASCSDDKTVNIWDINSGKCVHTYQEYKGHGQHLVWHPSDYYLALGLSNGTVKLYDTRKHSLLQHYRAHEDSITQISFHPNGNYLLVASQDSTMKILDLLEGHPIYTLMGHNGSITAVAFSSDGEYFASGGADKQIMIWKTNFADMENDNDAKENISQFASPAEHNVTTSNTATRVVDARKSMIYQPYKNDDEDDQPDWTTDNEEPWPSPITISEDSRANQREIIPVCHPNSTYLGRNTYSVMNSVVSHLDSVHTVLHIVERRLCLLEDYMYEKKN